MQEQNPFQSPAAAPASGDRRYRFDHFELGAAFSDGWQAATENAGSIIGLTLLYFLLMIPGLLSLGLLIPFFAFGYTKALFRLYDGEEAGSIIPSFSLFGVAFLGLVVVGAITSLPNIAANMFQLVITAFVNNGSEDAVATAALFTIPITLIGMFLGWLLAVRLVFASYTVIDQEVGPMEAIRSSWEDTKGQFFPAFLLVIAAGFLGSAGALLFLVGLIFTIPASYLVIIAAYRQLHPRDDPGGYALEPNAPEPELGAGFDPYQH